MKKNQLFEMQMWSCMLIPPSGCTKQFFFEDIEKSGTQNASTVILLQLAVCPQCHHEEIQQMLTFYSNLYCLKAYHRPGHSMCIVEKQKISLNTTFSSRLKPRADF
jgi:hypothetical protein